MFNISLLRKSIENKTLICISDETIGLVHIFKKINNKFLIINNKSIIETMNLLARHKILQREITKYINPNECVLVQDYNDHTTPNPKYYKNIFLIDTRIHSLTKLENLYKNYNYRLLKITINYCVMIIN